MSRKRKKSTDAAFAQSARRVSRNTFHFDVELLRAMDLDRRPYPFKMVYIEMRRGADDLTHFMRRTMPDVCVGDCLVLERQGYETVSNAVLGVVCGENCADFGANITELVRKTAKRIQAT